MSDLNKLKELALAISIPGRPAAWRASGLKGPITGRPIYSVYTDEDFGDIVASLDFDNDEPGWDRLAHAKFIAAANPETITALIDRLEAAEAELKQNDGILRSSVPERWKDCTSPVGSVQSYIAELEEACKLMDHDMDTVRYRNGLLENKISQLEAQLAALAAQEPVGYTTERAATYEVWNSGSACFWSDKDMGDFPLYARAAPPAVNLADLVPDEMTPKQASRIYSGEVRGFHDGWNAAIAKVKGGLNDQQ